MAQNRREAPKTAAPGAVDTRTMSPKERHAHWIQSKIERAGQSDTNVVSSKTKNVSDYVNLLNINDKLMSDCLLAFGQNPRVTVAFLEETRKRTEAAKEMINTNNAMICAAMQWEYRPPRPFVNPLAKAKAQANQAKQAAAKAAQKPQAKPVAAAPAQPAKAPKAAPKEGTAATTETQVKAA